MEPLPLGFGCKFGPMRIGHPQAQLLHAAIALLAPVALELGQSVFASRGPLQWLGGPNSADAPGGPTKTPQGTNKPVLGRVKPDWLTSFQPLGRR